MGIDDVAKRWTDLGEKDPLWAVLTDAGKSGGRWDAEEFLTSGREEIAAILETLRGFGMTPSMGTALDFGCGAGRLTQGLIDGGFTSAIGVDISAPMLEAAADLNRHGDKISFLHNQTPNLAAVPDASVDLVYSCRVLQHMPVEMSHAYIREFFRIVRPGGVVVFQIPDKLAPGLVGTAMRLTPEFVLNRVRKGMEMHGTSPEVVQELVSAAGGQIVRTLDDTAAGDRWISHTYFCSRTA